jgi:hypothetical protein
VSINKKSSDKYPHATNIAIRPGNAQHKKAAGSPRPGRTAVLCYSYQP